MNIHVNRLFGAAMLSKSSSYRARFDRIANLPRGQKLRCQIRTNFQDSQPTAVPVPCASTYSVVSKAKPAFSCVSRIRSS